jgi:hypothetical protein
MNKAIGGNSHSEGSSTESIGNMSHAEGYLTKANGVGAHSEGMGYLDSNPTKTFYNTA